MAASSSKGGRGVSLGRVVVAAACLAMGSSQMSKRGPRTVQVLGPRLYELSLPFVALAGSSQLPHSSLNMQSKPQQHADETHSNTSVRQSRSTQVPFKLSRGTGNRTSSERIQSERYVAGCFREMRQVVVEGGPLFSVALATAIASNQTNTHAMRAEGQSGREELVGQSTSSLFRMLVGNLKPGVLDDMSMRSSFLDVISRHVVATKRPGSTWSVSVDGNTQHAHPGKSTPTVMRSRHNPSIRARQNNRPCAP